MDIDKVLDSYDDDEAIVFIKNYLPETLKEKITDDDIQYFLDVMYILDEACIVDPDEFKRKFLSEAKKDEVEAITAENLEILMDAEEEYFKQLTVDS